jgi:hypothetical protein
MPPSAPLPEEIRVVLLSALGSGLVLVVLIQNTRRLLALIAREGNRSFEDLRWLEGAIQLLAHLPPGTRAELRCGSRHLRIEVPGDARLPGRDADVVPIDRPRRAAGDDAEDGPT